MAEPKTADAAGLARREQWRWYGSYGISTGVHVLVILALGVFFLPASPQPEDVSMEVGLERGPIEPPLLETVIKPLDEESGSPGSEIKPLEPRRPNVAKYKVDADDFRPQVPKSLLAMMAEAKPKDAKGGKSAPGSGKGDGDGNGTGTGVAKTKGFFNGELKGNSFVFVVDCSRSMNHPHKSEAKTRFRRLKMELLKAVGLMKPTQKFFIIFFNSEPLPMPSPIMQAGGVAAKNRYLAWAMRVPAQGDTDPRKALGMALALRPDVIYFLTDGNFKLGISRGLLKVRQNNTIINTITLGNRDGEETMKKIAEQNRGKYTFVP